MQNIIMTGTIVPQANFTAIDDWRTRRAEYIASINFYKKFKVDIYFLENSKYDIENDKEFQQDNVYIVKYTEDESDAYTLGKGYQEFKMIDHFIANNEMILNFYKITGRRIINNFEFYLDNYSKKNSARFDVFQKSGIVDTSFFFCNREFYLQHIKNKYAFVNDEDGMFIEKVLYKEFINVKYKFHFPSPIFHGVSGSTGAILNQKRWRITMKNIVRIMNVLVRRNKADNPVVEFARNILMTPSDTKLKLGKID